MNKTSHKMFLYRHTALIPNMIQQNQRVGPRIFPDFQNSMPLGAQGISPVAAA
jgi:hypothetical protein